MYCHSLTKKTEWLRRKSNLLKKYLVDRISYLLHMLNFRCPIQLNKGVSFQDLLLLLLSHFSPVRLCVTPQTAAHQAPPSTFCLFFGCKSITFHVLVPRLCALTFHFLPCSSFFLSWPHWPLWCHHHTRVLVTLPDQNLSLWCCLYLLKSLFSVNSQWGPSWPLYLKL